MSEQIAQVIQVYPKPHFNADSLEVCQAGGYQCLVRKGDFQDGDLAVFIPPDTICNSSRPEFSFLDTAGRPIRIKAKKLRGIWSEGLIIKAPEGVAAGDNLYETLGLTHYEPEQEHVSTGGNWAKAPAKWSALSKYDVENGKNSKYVNLFTVGEEVVVTGKLNGSNCCFVYSEEELHCRSRSGFRTRENNVFWNCLTPEIEKFCTDNPDYILYGESVGHVKGWKYDVPNGQVSFRAFDIYQPNRQYCCTEKFFELCDKFNIPTVPLICKTGFDLEKMIEQSQNPCPITGGLAEGIVVKPVVERYNERLGRVMVKFINPKYLEKN